MCYSFPTANGNVYFTYGMLIAQLSYFAKLCEDKEKEGTLRRKENSNHRFGAVRGSGCYMWEVKVQVKGVTFTELIAQAPCSSAVPTDGICKAAHM